MKRTPLYMALAGLAISGASTLTFAQDQVIEEVIVTGSYIPGSPEDAAAPVDVITSQDLAEVGSPSTIEMIRNLGVTSGNIGEANQFQPGAQNAAGVTNINLRGLGGGRTLSLLNGKRQVSTQLIGVDLSALPSAAIGRMEVLKDGAAALYGSDAMAGVVNFITRKDFQGLEVRGSYQHIEDAGDYDLGFIYGLGTENLNWTLSGEFRHRDELGLKDRDWGLPSLAENPEAGYSTIGHPGVWYDVGNGFSVAPDPQCALLSGNASCAFQYTYFDNLVEEQDNQKWFTELNWAINDDTNFHVEALYGKMELNRATSPSYPPQSLFGPDRFVDANHPGLINMIAQYPAYFPNPNTPGVYPVNRYAGVTGVNGGESEYAERITEQYRFGAGFDGMLFDGGINYDISLTWSQRDRVTYTDDMYVERMAFAIDGLGGPNCDRNAAVLNGTQGQNGCLYYNPFSNGIQKSVVTGAENLDFVPALANSDVLLDWLTYELPTINTDTLLVFDATFNGETGIELPGGNVGWAAGIQTRRERFTDDRALNDLDQYPCPFNDPLSVTLGYTASLDCGANDTGMFAFLSGGFETDVSRRIYAMFTEFGMPITDDLNMQLAVRFEDYGGLTGSTVDPKLALRWQATDFLAFRGSVSTTFRGPAQSILEGRNTTLSYISQTRAFKAVDTYGNEDLTPESALSSNIGALLDFENFRASLDYWRFDVTDPFQVESANQVLAEYASNGCEGNPGDPGPNTPVCNELRDRIQFSSGDDLAQLERVGVFWQNGADFIVDGVDLNLEYDMDALGGELTFGGEFTYLLGYEYDDFLTIDGTKIGDGGDYAGFLNDGFQPTPLPELKGNLSAKYRTGGQTVSLIARYVSSYEDAIAPVSDLETIDSQVTFDLNYNAYLFDDALRLSLSVFNITDEDPPAAATDLAYDAFTHNPLGRMIKVGAVYNFDF